MRINKRLLVVILILALVSVSGVVIFVKKQPKEEGTTQVTKTLQVDTTGVDTVIPELPSITQDTINNSLKGIIRQNVTSPKTSYNAVYRKGSLVKSKTSTGTPIVQFLVDIPELQRTFLIEIEGDDTTPSKTIYAQCPNPGQDAYSNKSCEDTP